MTKTQKKIDDTLTALLEVAWDGHEFSPAERSAALALFSSGVALGANIVCGAATSLLTKACEGLSDLQTLAVCEGVSMSVLTATNVLQNDCCDLILQSGPVQGPVKPPASVGLH